MNNIENKKLRAIDNKKIKTILGLFSKYLLTLDKRLNVKTTSYYFFLCVFFLISAASFGGDSLAFSKNKIFVSLGYGYVGNETTKYSVVFPPSTATSYGVELQPVSGPFCFKAEYALDNTLGLGISLYMTNYNLPAASYSNGLIDSVTLSFKGPVMSALLRANAHFKNFSNTDRVDFYAGIGLGLIYRNFKYYSNSDKASITLNGDYVDQSNVFNKPFNNKLAIEVTIGIRQFISKFVGLYGEFGYSTISMVLVNGGVVMKF